MHNAAYMDTLLKSDEHFQRDRGPLPSLEILFKLFINTPVAEVEEMKDTKAKQNLEGTIAANLKALYIVDKLLPLLSLFSHIIDVESVLLDKDFLDESAQARRDIALLQPTPDIW